MVETITLVSSDKIEFIGNIVALADSFTYFQGLSNSPWSETAMKRISFSDFDNRTISLLIEYSKDKKRFLVNFNNINFEEYLHFTTYFGSRGLLIRCVFYKIRELSVYRREEFLKHITSKNPDHYYVTRVRKIINLLVKYNVRCLVLPPIYWRCRNLLECERRRVIRLITYIRSMEVKCDSDQRFEKYMEIYERVRMMDHMNMTEEEEEDESLYTKKEGLELCGVLRRIRF